MRSKTLIRYPLLASSIVLSGSLLSNITAAAPGTPTIAWMETNYAAPANYTVKWDMWWGDNGNTWYLLENNNIIHTGAIIANGQNAQQSQFTVAQSAAGQFTYQVKLCDNSVTPESCSLSASKTIVVSGDAVNQAPVVNAGSDQQVAISNSVTLNASYTDDGLSTPVSNSWSTVSGPGTATFTDATLATTGVSFDAIGEYILRFSVNDNEFTSSDDITISVSAEQANQPPVANAGVDKSVSVGTTLTLQGSFTDDGNSTAVSQSWSQLSGPENISFSDPTLASPSVTFNSVGSYVLDYTVNDGEYSASDQLNIEVTAASSLEKPNRVEIAWRSPSAALSNGKADIALTWNKYSGISGTSWELLQNDQLIHSATIAENGNNLQTASTVATVNSAGSYSYVVALCQGSGSQKICSHSNPLVVTVTGTGGGLPATACDTNAEPCLPNRADPVALAVKGWPSTLAMGSITDNSASINDALASANLDAIFKYSGDGMGDRGRVIEPIVTLQTINQARQVEAINAHSVVPTMVVYTANASGGGVAAEDITDYNNLVMHYQNLIRLTAVMQAQKDAQHPNPGSIILNADLLGEWQKGQLSHFKDAFGDSRNWTNIAIKQAVKEAIVLEANYQFTNSSGNTVTLNSLYNLQQLQTEVDSALADNIKGWVQSQNFIVKRFSPDVSFSWLVNLWSPGSANWVHDNYSGQQAVWNAASLNVAKFIDWIGAYDDNAYQPDYLTFDKYERDGFSPIGRANYAFGAKEWQNYLNYVKQVTDHLDTPAMLWQIPGGHMPTNGESSGSYDLQNSASSAASFFMGDENIGSQISNIRSEVLTIPLNASVYDGATSVQALLSQTPNYDWGVSQLRQSAYSNVFAILWGGGSTTAVVPINTNGSGDNNWLRDKIVSYQANGKIPLYHTASATTSQPLTSISQLNIELESIDSKMNNQVFLYETPDSQWIPSTVYKWNDFLAALNPMHNVGIGDVKFWLTDPSVDDATNIKYAKVAIAAFLAQSMKETIQYNACDENNWSINTGDPVNYPLSSSCGQLGQVYADYGTNAQGIDNPYSCPRNDKMEISALTHAKWYGAPAPLFTAPDAVLEEKGLLVNGHVGRWDYQEHCNVSPTSIDTNAQVYDREDCKAYVGQKAGKFVWDGSAQKSVQGCGWWGRGVIQTTGRLNFGKLNHFIGRSHVAADKVGNVVDGTLVKAAPSNPLYADLDLCANPQLVCSTQEHKEIKWIAGLFFWMNEVQGYNNVGGPYASWNYHEQLKAYVDGGLQGSKFIDDVSGIVNRGCPDTSCPVSGAVDGLAKRKDNFVKALEAMGLNPKSL
ncbi:PKD domain-containing protein [Shewanella sp. 10N.286.54.B9]|uniref:PKD domain-containing protein n=1 Tax=Shewanella sp. 10N.286.54.B9 TaxID=3229719 RepID=UPI00354E09D5